MTTELRLRRGTAAQHASFTGALGEVTVDTTNNRLIVHDGATPGGFPVLALVGGILPGAQGGTGGNTAAAARSGISAAASGANGDITSLSALSTALSIAQGGTGATSAATALTALGAYSKSEVDSKDDFRNRLYNGDFAVDQEFAGSAVTVTAGAALKWVIDGWYAKCTGANVTFQTITTAGRKRGRITGAASNTGVTFGTRIAAADSADMANKFATISALLSSSSITTVNWALNHATSTDTFTTGTAITSGSFTINSTETAYSAITAAALAAGATTGIELVFTFGALLAAATITFGDVQLERGKTTTPSFSPYPYAFALARCGSLWESDSFSYLTYQANTAGFSFRQLFKFVKRVAPASLTITSPTYYQANSGSATAIDRAGATMGAVAANGSSGAAQVAFTWVADVRLTT
jgi:hypothetical protein